MCESIGHRPLWSAALLTPSTSITTYLGRARVPLTIWRFCDHYLYYPNYLYYRATKVCWPCKCSVASGQYLWWHVPINTAVHTSFWNHSVCIFSNYKKILIVDIPFLSEVSSQFILGERVNEWTNKRTNVALAWISCIPLYMIVKVWVPSLSSPLLAIVTDTKTICQEVLLSVCSFKFPGLCNFHDSVSDT